eukprot:Opistho-2@21511
MSALVRSALWRRPISYAMPLSMSLALKFGGRVDAALLPVAATCALSQVRHARTLPPALLLDAVHTLPLELNAKAPGAKTPTPQSVRTGVLARKVGMTFEWDLWGKRLPLTVLQLEDVQVVSQKTVEKHGYNALQIGAFNVHSGRSVSRTVKGMYRAIDMSTKKELSEFRVTEDALLPSGTPLTAAHFLPGQYVDVQGTTKGKGWAGPMKRHGFKGLGASHGVSLKHRAHGSIGQNTSPGRVFKGKKMAGRMGGKHSTQLSLEVFKVNNKFNLVFVKGSVAGPKKVGGSHHGCPPQEAICGASVPHFPWRCLAFARRNCRTCD